MTGITARSVIHETLDPTVILSHLRLITVLVTGNASEHREIRAVGVAIAALRPLTVVLAAVDREIGRIVRCVLGAGPIDERVTRVADLAEPSRGVIGIGGGVVIRLMAAPAIARRRRI